MIRFAFLAVSHVLYFDLPLPSLPFRRLVSLIGVARGDKVQLVADHAVGSFEDALDSWAVMFFAEAIGAEQLLWREGQERRVAGVV